MMAIQRIDQLISVHRNGLLNDTIPFWMTHGMDWQFGGLRNFLDADGSVYNDDKAVWQTGRFGWITAFLYNEVEQRDEWLQASKACNEFLDKHCFDAEGRMFFEVTRDGKPLRRRRYAYSETFCIMARSEYARATGDNAWANKARELFDRLLSYYHGPNFLPPKYDTNTRPMRSHGETMVVLALIQQLRRNGESPKYNEVADRSFRDVRDLFLHREKRALLETVGPNGEFIDTPMGRTVNPGHAIETAWFLMSEARHRGNMPEVIETACTILDWSLKLGWDEKHGGIRYFGDIDGKPCEQYEHDMKLAWPHNEALVACLMAYTLTKNAKYLQWYERVHEWAYARFPDKRHGDWFKYLHFDGSLASTRKGSHWVSCFHLPRQQFVCWKLLEEIKRGMQG